MGPGTWWQVMSRAVQTKKPEMAWAAVVIRNTGCSMAVGLPSGITETLGEAAMVVGDAGSGARAAPLTVMVPGSRGSLRETLAVGEALAWREETAPLAPFPGGWLRCKQSSGSLTSTIKM